MTRSQPGTNFAHLITVGLLGWVVPGGGHFLIGERNRGLIIFVTIALTFFIGLWVGSIGVIDPVYGKIPYAGQILNSPGVAALAKLSVGRGYQVFGRPNEIGQIYTSISGLLNLLCVVNAVYLAHVKDRAKWEQ